MSEKKEEFNKQDYSADSIQALEGMEHGKVGSKIARITNLQPYFRSRSVWFPDHADWLEELKSELRGVTQYEIKSEYIDLVDAMAMHDQWGDDYSVMNIANEKRFASLPTRAIT